MKTLLLLLFVFVAGVFLGIWMDWSASPAGGRNFVYQVQNYPMANLLVYGGDTITLVPPAGGDGSGLAMSFVGGYNPCVPGGDPSTCTIDPQASAGPYLFNCSSPKGYSCPDPGIQQSPTGPGPVTNFSYGRAVEKDFAHLVGGQHSSGANPAPAQPNVAHPATSAITAYVSCVNETTALNDPNGNSLTTITASSGQTVYWISPKPFTLNTSSFPAGLCSNGNPGNGNTTEAQCTIALPGQSVQYGVQAQTTPSCNALPAILLTK
jgi:hypothetical protein